MTREIVRYESPTDRLQIGQERADDGTLVFTIYRGRDDAMSAFVRHPNGTLDRRSVGTGDVVEIMSGDGRQLLTMTYGRRLGDAEYDVMLTMHDPKAMVWYRGGRIQ